MKDNNLKIKQKIFTVSGQILLSGVTLGTLSVVPQLIAHADTPVSTDQKVSVYRLYQPQSKVHFYTTDVNYYNNKVISDPSWVKEGVAFEEPEKSDFPVFRLYNTKTGEYYFTANNDEANKLITASANLGWQNDTSLVQYQHDTTSKTIAFYSAAPDQSNIPVFSLYNAQAGLGEHFYTASQDEATTAENDWNWTKFDDFNNQQGVAWYALSQENNTPEQSTTTNTNSTPASNYPIPGIPSGWQISKPINTSHYSSATYNFRQCTWFAWNRAKEFGINFSPYMGNGQDWQSDAGYRVTSTPVLHSVVSFKGGQFSFNRQYGHVAFVEAIHPDGSILVSESGLGYSSLYVYQIFTAQEASQLHFVIGQ